MNKESSDYDHLSDFGSVICFEIESCDAVLRVSIDITDVFLQSFHIKTGANSELTSFGLSNRTGYQ